MTEFEEGLLAEAARVATALKWIGNGDAHSPMGAIEAYSVHQRKGLDGIAEALQEVAEALGIVANAIERARRSGDRP